MSFHFNNKWVLFLPCPLPSQAVPAAVLGRPGRELVDRGEGHDGKEDEDGLKQKGQYFRTLRQVLTLDIVY